MAEKVTFDPATKIISVNLGVRSLDVQYDVYSGWKRWVVSDIDNSKYESALRTVGGDPLVSGKSLGATFFLTNGWKIRPPEEDCELNVIGNLYDDLGGAVFVKTLGAYNAMVIQTVSNLTDSQVVESELAKSLDYNGVVYYNETSTWSGTEYPVGTVNHPVNNITDALLLCDKVGTKSIRIYGNLTIDRNIEAYCFQGMDSSSCIFFNNRDVSLCTFNDAALYGSMTGSIRANTCVLDNINGLSGEFNTCALKGVIRFANADSCFVQCFTKHGAVDSVTFDGTDIEAADVCFRAYSGSIHVTGFINTDAHLEFDFISGSVFIDSTNMNFGIICRGIAKIVNLSAVTIDMSSTMSTSYVTETIFSTPMVQFTDSNTFGGFVKNKLLTVAKFIGLS